MVLLVQTLINWQSLVCKNISWIPITEVKNQDSLLSSTLMIWFSRKSFLRILLSMAIAICKCWNVSWREHAKFILNINSKWSWLFLHNNVQRTLQSLCRSFWLLKGSSCSTILLTPHIYLPMNISCSLSWNCT